MSLLGDEVGTVAPDAERPASPIRAGEPGLDRIALYATEVFILLLPIRIPPRPKGRKREQRSRACLPGVALLPSGYSDSSGNFDAFDRMRRPLTSRDGTEPGSYLRISGDYFSRLCLRFSRRFLRPWAEAPSSLLRLCFFSRFHSSLLFVNILSTL